MRKGILVSMVAVAGMASAASAQYSDGFESYPTGSLNAGGWDGWDGSAGARGSVTNAFARSGSQSLEISGGADAVHPFTGFTSGQWTMTAWMLLFRNDHTTDTYFIVNNEYNHNGPYTWTIEIQFDTATGNVLDDFRPETNTIPIAFGTWAEIRIVFDLDNDTQTTFYNGVELSTGTMTRSAGDPLEIANIDLFTLGAKSYYDDISIVPAPGAMGVLVLGAGAFMRRRRR